MKMRFKFLVCFTLISSLFAVCCGGVSAANAAEWVAPDNYKIFNNETGVIGTLKTSMLEPDAKKFMLDYFNDNTDYIVFCSSDRLRFIKMVKPYNSNSFRYYSSTLCDFRGAFDSVEFFPTTGEPSYPKVFRYPAITDSGRVGAYIEKLIRYSPITNTGFPKNYIISIWKPVRDSSSAGYSVVFDDIGNPPEPPTSSEPESSEPPTSSEPESSEPPTSSEPESSEPPTSSEPESSEPPLSSQPELPQPPPVNEDYLGITPTAVKNVFAYLTQTIGTAVNSGWVIFFYLAGIVVIIKLIRYFLGE